MRTLPRFPLRSLLCLAVLVALKGPAAPAARAEAAPDGPRQAAAPSCRNRCRGLGVEKVQAGEEHCGLVPREIKDEALDAACGLAESHRERLQRRAEEKARQRCADESDQEACLCRSQLRRWQNVYTHALSQNCWTECGWAFFIDCQRRGDPDDG